MDRSERMKYKWFLNVWKGFFFFPNFSYYKGMSPTAVTKHHFPPIDLAMYMVHIQSIHFSVVCGHK